MVINGIEIQITRKFVKHLRLGVHPPDGMVRITAPWFVTDAQVRRMLASKLSWIEEKQAAFRLRPSSPATRLVSGETHYVRGQAYHLNVVACSGRPKVFIQDSTNLVMEISPEASVIKREAVLNAWYRSELMKRISPLIEKWEPIMGERVLEWRIKKMKTRWGTCNARARRIWLNLELAKKSSECLEYVIVHEMVHFFERYHNAHFKALMDSFLPNWRLCKHQLNAPCEITG